MVTATWAGNPNEAGSGRRPRVRRQSSTRASACRCPTVRWSCSVRPVWLHRCELGLANGSSAAETNAQDSGRARRGAGSGRGGRGVPVNVFARLLSRASSRASCSASLPRPARGRRGRGGGREPGQQCAGSIGLVEQERLGPGRTSVADLGGQGVHRLGDRPAPGRHRSVPAPNAATVASNRGRGRRPARTPGGPGPVGRQRAGQPRHRPGRPDRLGQVPAGGLGHRLVCQACNRRIWVSTRGPARPARHRRPTTDPGRRRRPTGPQPGTQLATGCPVGVIGWSVITANLDPTTDTPPTRDPLVHKANQDVVRG